MKDFEEINIIINWYYKESGNNVPIENFIRAKDKLSVLSYRIAQISADNKRDYNLSYFQRKINVSKSIQSFINNKLNFNKAEINALIANEHIYKEELIKESDAYRTDILLKQINKIIDALSQRISYLKKEEILSKSHV